MTKRSLQCRITNGVITAGFIVEMSQLQATNKRSISKCEAYNQSSSCTWALMGEQISKDVELKLVLVRQMCQKYADVQFQNDH